MDVMDIALNVKRLRLGKGLTVDALAAKTGVTKGYISQVENMRTRLSLPVLYKIASALEVAPADLLAEGKPAKKYVLIKRGKGERVEREYPESGFIYKALAKNKNNKLMEPFLLELPAKSSRKDVTTNGDEFIYMLSGEAVFHLAGEEVELKEGDSLYFEGAVPHHPWNRTGKKAIMLVLYSIRTEAI